MENSEETALVPVNRDEEAIVPVQQDAALPDTIGGFRPSRVIFAAVIGIFALIFLGGMIFGPASANQKNVVSDFKPVSERFSSPSFEAARKALKDMPAEQRAAYLDKNFPRLHEDIIYYLRERNKLSPSDKVTSVQFLFGTANGVKAEDGDGNMNSGKFEDQLIARVAIAGKDKPMDVIVQCLNGTFGLPGDLQALSSRTPRQEFTIGAGEGLTTYVSMPTAIDIAPRFNLPLYRGKVLASRYEISPEVAATINTDVEPVTVRVYTGDHFDLVNMTFRSAQTKDVIR